MRDSGPIFPFLLGLSLSRKLIVFLSPTSERDGERDLKWDKVDLSKLIHFTNQSGIVEFPSQTHSYFPRSRSDLGMGLFHITLYHKSLSPEDIHSIEKTLHAYMSLCLRHLLTRKVTCMHVCFGPENNWLITLTYKGKKRTRTRLLILVKVRYTSCFLKKCLTSPDNEQDVKE